MPVIDLTLDSKGAVAGLKKYDKAVDKSQKNTTTAFDKMRTSVNDLGTAIGVGLAAGVAALGAFGLKALEMASSLQETQGVFDQVFKGMEDTAEGWALTLRKAYQMTEEEAKNSLSALTGVISGMGVAKDAAGEMAFSLSKVGADLGAAFNRSSVDVVNDIRSAISGSTETLDKYNIVVRESIIKQKAVEMGLAASTKEVTQAHKAQAIYALVLEKTADIQGTNARELEEYGGQLRLTKQAINEITIAIGQQLLPIATKAITAFNEWITASGRLEGIITGLITTVQFLYNGFKGIVIVAKAVIVAIAAVAEGFSYTLKPFSLFLDGLVALGRIDSNPLDGLIEGIKDFRKAAVEGMLDTIDTTLEMNNTFEKAKETVKETAEVAKQAAVENASVLAAEKQLLLEKNAVLEIVGDTEKVNAERAAWLNKKNQEEAEARLGRLVDERAGVSALGTEEDKLATEVAKVTTEADKSVVALNSQAAAANKVAAAVEKVADANQRTSATKEGTYEASAAWSGGKKSMGSAPAMTPAEMEQYRAMTPAGRGDHYWDSGRTLGPMGGDGSRTHDRLDENLVQSEAALKAIMGARSGGATTINNFNQQISVSDIVSITDQQVTNEARA